MTATIEDEGQGRLTQAARRDDDLYGRNREKTFHAHASRQVTTTIEDKPAGG